MNSKKKVKADFKMEQMKNNFIVQAWLVLILALCFGSSIASINLALSPIIKTNKINETMEKVPELVLGINGAAKLTISGKKLDINSQMVTIERKNSRISYKVFQAINEEEVSGWVVKASGQGYADKIELLIGLDKTMESITGLFVLEQKETPGLGSKISQWDFRKQFVSKKTKSPIIPTKTGASASNEIDAITGATISSRSVCSIVNVAAKNVRTALAKTPFKINQEK